MTYEQRKLALCLRVARESSRMSWQDPVTPTERKELRKIRHESIQVDARYWVEQLKKETIK